MKRIDKLASAGQTFIALLFVSMSLVQGVYGIEVTASGGSNGESGSVGMNFDLAKDATANSELVIEGAAVTPTTTIGGPISKFEQTHAVKDSSGKSASVSVKVVNAPNGLTYESDVQPGEGSVTTKPWVSAEQWLTVPKADSIECTSSSSYGSWSADAGIKEYKGPCVGDYVTLTGYYGRAYASEEVVSAEQTASKGTGYFINIFNHAKDDTELFSIDTNLDGFADSDDEAKFQGLNSLSSAGDSSQATQKEHIQGAFTSTASYDPATGSTTSKTRTTNYGREFDLNMQALKGSLSGTVGYYVVPGMATQNIGAIQGAVNAAQSGDTINAVAGTYKENVVIDKSLNVKGDTGNTIIDGQKKGSVFSIGRNKANVDVTLSGMTITGGSADYGAGIYNRARLNVADSTISGNVANYWGGGIRNRGILTVTGSDISGNTAVNGAGIDNSGEATVTDSTISGNDANFGGGIENTGKLTVTGNTISENTATHGGGIFSSGTAWVSDSTISNNKAEQGGSIENSGNIIVTSGIISGNTASDAGSGICNKGTGTFTVTDSTFSGNSAKYGTIYNSPTSTLKVLYSDISGNDADFGGAIDNDGVLTVKGSNMADNVAGDGGAIYNFGTATITGCTISGNIVEDRWYYGINNPGQGGGIYNHGTATVTGCTISGNAANAGGGIWNKAGDKVTLTDSKILGNIADYGAGICNEGITDVIRSTISGNTANLYTNSQGGGIGNYGSSSVLNLYSGSITNNRAALYGGGIRNAGTVNIIGSYPDLVIEDNIASVSEDISNKGVVNGNT
jgi:hypothetical protein